VAGVLIVLAGSSATGASTATAALAPRTPPAAPLFAGVPAEGFPDRFPFGQCTWWAAYNRAVTWNGNAGDWLANAQAHGVATAAAPSIGAIAVFHPGGAYSPSAHVAIVIAVSPADYTVSEMNAVGWGLVSTRTLAWPDPQAEGFIPLAELAAVHGAALPALFG